MRLDKFLKISRLIKQRSRARELCDAGAVIVNGRKIKASHAVHVGDDIRVIIGDKKVSAVILEIPDGNVSKKRAREIINIKGVEWLDEAR